VDRLPARGRRPGRDPLPAVPSRRRLPPAPDPARRLLHVRPADAGDAGRRRPAGGRDLVRLDRRPGQLPGRGRPSASSISRSTTCSRSSTSVPSPSAAGSTTSSSSTGPPARSTPPVRSTEEYSQQIWFAPGVGKVRHENGWFLIETNFEAGIARRPDPARFALAGWVPGHGRPSRSDTAVAGGRWEDRMSLLDHIATSADVARLHRDQLAQLAAELRAEIIDVCSETGGHLASSLGVVELTVALHHVHDSAPRPDRVGRGPPDLRPQDPDRPARPDATDPQGGRAGRLHHLERVRARRADRRPRQHQPGRRARHGARARRPRGARTTSWP
jgi:hypothetical protein